MASALTSNQLTIILVATIESEPKQLEMIIRDFYDIFKDFDIKFISFSFHKYDTSSLPIIHYKRYFEERDLREYSKLPNVLIIDSAGTFEYYNNGTEISFNKYYGENPAFTYERFKIKCQYIPIWYEYEKDFYINYNTETNQIETLFSEIYKLENLEDLVFNKFRFVDKYEKIITLLTHDSVLLGIKSHNIPEISLYITIENINRLRPDLIKSGDTEIMGDLRTNINGFRRIYKLSTKYFEKYLKYKSKYINLRNKLKI
jgi:hypothetical protein